MPYVIIGYAIPPRKGYFEIHRFNSRPMSKELINKKTRYEFREYFVGTTLREIEMEFDAANVTFDEEYDPPTSGARRSLVEKYYNTIDFTKWGDVRKILTVYGNVLVQLEEQAESGTGYEGGNWARRTFQSLKKWIERDGFVYKDGKLTPVGNNIHLPQVSEAAQKFDAPELHRQIERMRNSVDDDPALAIGTAKELVETTCKTILHERGIDFDEDADIVQLVKVTRKALDLLPEQIPDSAKGADVIRRLLSNLATLAQGLGELRNLYGTGHGRKGSTKGLSPRHARLAVGAGSTLATFLFETHEQRRDL